MTPGQTFLCKHEFWQMFIWPLKPLNQIQDSCRKAFSKCGSGDISAGLYIKETPENRVARMEMGHLTANLNIA